MSDIKQITLPSGTTYDLRDSRVDSLISQVTRWVGTTTTAIADGDTATIIVIDGEDHTAVVGDITSYNNMEYICTEVTRDNVKVKIWQEFGSTGSLKALAFKDSVAVKTAVPSAFSASVSSAGATDTVTGITAVGSMPTYTVQNEVLTITAGATPTADTQKTFKTGDASYSVAVTGTTDTSGTVTYTP